MSECERSGRELQSTRGRRSFGSISITFISILILSVMVISSVLPMLSNGEVSKIIKKGNMEYDSIILEFGPNGGIDPSLSLPIPGEGPVISTSFTISTVPGAKGPDLVSIDIGIDGRIEWAFGEGAEGTMGEQNTFITESTINRELISGRGNEISLLIPRGAKVYDSNVEISTPPTPESGLKINLFDLLPSDVNVESIDAGDIDNDGLDEIIYHSTSDSAVYMIDLINNSSPKRHMILSDVVGRSIIRAISWNDVQIGGIIVQYSNTSADRDRISFLKGDPDIGMEEMVLSSGLSPDKIGFHVLENGRNERTEIMVIGDSGIGISRCSFTESGALMKQLIMNDITNISGVGSLDADGDGKMDLILFPENENVTIILSGDREVEDQKTYVDLGSHLSINGVGATLDMDGDGGQEFYFTSGEYDDMAVIGINGENEVSWSWIDFNITTSSPRVLTRDTYGDSGAYIGSEGFLYAISHDGLFHLIPVSDPIGTHIFSQGHGLRTLSILGDMDLDGSGKIYSIEKTDGLIMSDLIWKGVEEISLSSIESTLDHTFSGTSATSLDIGELIQTSSLTPTLSDEYGNILHRIDIDIEGSNGFISFGGLSITYDITFEASNSQSFLLSVQKAQDDFDDAFIPFMVSAGSGGKVMVGPAEVTYDSPPIILPSMPSELQIMEGSLGTTLINIRNHLEDDLMDVEMLDLDILPISEIPLGLLFIDRNGGLISHASEYPDLYGEIVFQIGVGDRYSISVSSPITLKVLAVQDPPVLINGVDEIHIIEGEEAKIQLSGPEGLFIDPDGDTLSFDQRIISTEPLELMDHLEISMEQDHLTISPLITGMGGTARLEITANDPFTKPSEQAVAIVHLRIKNIDSKPWIGENPGLIVLSEDQDTPTKIELNGWMVDPDTHLSEYELLSYSSDPRLHTYFDLSGNEPYLFLIPSQDLFGQETVWIELIGENITLTDRLKVEIEEVNDIPEVAIQDVEYQRDMGWVISGIVTDPDDSGGRIEYRIGTGEWRDSWGFSSWSFLVEEKAVPGSGIYVFIRAYDGVGTSTTEYIKLLWPFDPPTPREEPERPPGDDGKDTQSYTDSIIAPKDPDENDTPWAIIGGLSGIIMGGILFLLWSEVGFVTMVTAGMSIYSKLSKKDILNHEIRGLIRGYIIANPGDHYSSIKRNLDLNNGTLAYHLKVLEQNGFIKSMYDGIYKRYYPANINISKLKKNVSKQEEIFNIILDHPGVTMEQIGRSIGVSRQVVNYHVKNLIRGGVVTYTRDSKSARFYPAERISTFEQT